MVKRILVGLSGTPFTPTAVRYACELARRHEARVTGVTIVDTLRIEDVGPVPVGGGAAAHALVEHRLEVTEERVEEACAAFETACRDAGLVHHVVRESGNPMDALKDLSRYHDLTVLGLRGLFEYGVVHQPNDEVIRLLVHGVRPILAVSETPRPIGRALIAYNGSMEAAKAMRQFVQMGLWPDVELRLVCFDRDADHARSLLEHAAAYCRAHGHEAETEWVAGDAADDLLAHAEDWNADIIVMGATGRHKLLKLVMGDVALEALLLSDVPLFMAQ